MKKIIALVGLLAAFAFSLPFPVRYFLKGSNVATDLAAMGSRPWEYDIVDTMTLTGNLTIPANIDLRPVKSGIIKRTHATDTLFINGSFEAGRYQVFDTLAPVLFSNGSVFNGTAPQWWGAKGDGVTDDSKALQLAFSAATNQYGGIGANLGSAKFAFTKTLVIRKNVIGTGWVLLPKGNGSGFKAANNLYPLTTAPNRVDCMIVIQDGGRLEGGSIQVTTDTLDSASNAGMYVVNLESNFGKQPLVHVRIDGKSNRRNLNGVISRYNTTSDIGPFGGAYFDTGFKVDANNICTFHDLFFENTPRGSAPFYFTNSSHNTAQDLWTEVNGNNVIAFKFDGVSNYRIRNLKVGEPEGGAQLTGTAAASTDSITQDSNYLHLVNDRVVFDSVVAGLTAGSVYCVVSATSTAFQVGPTCGGAAANITANGSVTWRSALANAVRLTSSTNCILEGLNVENGAAWSSGVTLFNGSTASIRADNTFSATAASYGMWAEDQFNNERMNVFKYVDVQDTNVYRFVGDIKLGSQLSFVLVARTAGLSGTDGSINVFYLDGTGYHPMGTASVSSGALAFQGNVTTTTFSIDNNRRVYIAPQTPAGTGFIDIFTKWNIVDGL